MTWETFIYFAIPSVILWAAGAYFAFRDKRKLALTLTITGILVFAAYIAGIWISLERPPLRTMGETRLWYSFFLPVAGLMTYLRWKYKWILSFSTILALEARPNTEPSMNVMPSVELDPDCTTSP